MIATPSQSMTTPNVYLVGNDAVDSESEFSRINYPSEFDVNDSGITRELIMQYIDAGILFPEEIRHAEELLRQINEMTQIS